MKTLSQLLPKEYVEKRNKAYELRELKRKKKTYWDFLGELGFYMGFEAVQAVLSDYIKIEQAVQLLGGARRAYFGTVYDHAVASSAAARGVYKATEFDRLTKFYRDNM